MNQEEFAASIKAEREGAYGERTGSVSVFSKAGDSMKAQDFHSLQIDGVELECVYAGRSNKYPLVDIKEIVIRLEVVPIERVPA